MDEKERDLWRLASDLSVEDAAILIAGGDPSDVDWEDDTFGRQFPVKRTEGHPGYLPVFTGLRNAVLKGQLRATFHYQAEPEGAHSRFLGNQVWIVSALELSRLRSSIEAGDPLAGEASIRVKSDPDWSRTTVDVEELKVWLRSRGYTQCFFFPVSDEIKPSDEAFMDSSHDHFSPELALAVAVWRALASDQKTNRSPKQAIETWIDSHPEAWKGEGPLSASAKERVVTIVNWRKTGGAPTSGS